MREILFRGKRTDNDEWVYGAFCPKSCDTPFGPMVDRPSIIKLENPCSGFWFDVALETVGQYTGLTDKNGKKIFEGDIVRYEDAKADFEGYHDNVFMNIGVVALDPWSGVTFSNRQTVETEDLYDSETSIEAVVIGNIHDNPELLGAADE